ncbi:MarR family winged helix-turn-helix transcriptional regulator [Sphaerisporangium aureirubrum]|uniref:MarR family winged helix-turn-helix transcriptional regulator n=1 Tax=Sphaerisporangium aureirubrum TaxID=1544736 RepID=A0ABW1NS86_9ACTN
MSNDQADQQQDPTNGGPALFRLVRFWSRRWINTASQELTGEPRHVQHILAVEAVHTAAKHSTEITVGTVAHHLGLDHSGASRIIRDAVEAGYLTRLPSPQDRRRASLHLTDPGHSLLHASHQWQNQTFTALTATWPPQDRHQFATYLNRLADDLSV